MRFLLECVGCCMMSAASSGEDSTAEPSPPATPRTEETRSLVVAPSETRRRKRASSRNAAADWRPSLFAIAEDNAVPVGPEKKENRSRPAGSRNVKRCGTSSVRVNAHTRPHDFGYGLRFCPVFFAFFFSLISFLPYYDRFWRKSGKFA